MTHLLGRQDCIDSLRRDLIDLQGAVLDVFSKTGPVRFQSWKFPDKLSCNLDLVPLLKEYDYEEDKVERSQHAHVVLQELLIDRIMLLLQSFNVHVELQLDRRSSSSSGTNEDSVSVGPLVKRFWNNLLCLSSLNTHESEDANQFPQHSPCMTETALTSISPSNQTVSCQTSECVACEACARVQPSLKEISDAVVSLCRSLGLPCSTQGHVEAVEAILRLCQLSARELSQWAKIQCKDLGRVGKHVEEVRENIEELKNKLNEGETERDRLKKQQSEAVKSEKRRKGKLEEEWKSKMKEVQKTAKETEMAIMNKLEDLKRDVLQLEHENSEIKAELRLETRTKQSLELDKRSLLEEVHNLRSLDSLIKELREKKEDLEDNLRRTMMRLEKEMAKNQSFQRQYEALQMKQLLLCKRLDVLVQQNEDLQNKQDICEDAKALLDNKLTQTQQEKDNLQVQLNQQLCHSSLLTAENQKQQVQISELENKVFHLKEMIEEAAQRERILVAFPEFNTSAQRPKKPTGNMVCDMEQQLMANSVRIRVLQQENISLCSNITRLKEHHRGEEESSQESGLEMDQCIEEAAVQDSDKSSVSSASSLPIHCQTLCLPLEHDADERYVRRLRQANRARSVAVRRRKKSDLFLD